ncbi:MAG TPA: hypothetical protein VER96_10130 [Polyangiaceae bacterium]|nr:hypothetical protein [Polyangiaceae bacterium]
MRRNAWIVRNIVFGVLVGVLSGCAAQSSSPAPHSTPASTSGGHAQAFVADVLAGGAGLERRHSLVIVGPALTAEVKALDSNFEQLGSAVELMNTDGQSAALGRVCSEETCAKFLHAKGLREVLQPFGKGEYRSPSAAERKIMRERSPDHFPESTPATVAVAGEHVLGIYVVEEHMIWVELLSKPYQVTFAPDPDAPSAPEGNSIEETRCLKLNSVQLDQEEKFVENTTPQDLAKGVARIVGLLDELLFEAKSQATGSWTPRFAFDKSGLTKGGASPKSGIDPAIIKQLGEKAAGGGPFSRGPELWFQLEFTLRPCGK